MFVKAIREYAGEVAVRSVENDLRHPNGDRSAKLALQESRWFLGLSQQDKKRVLKIARKAMDYTVFGVFSILDGVRAVEASERKGEFRVKFLKNSREIEISNPSEVLLHELYRELYPFK